MRSSKPTKQRKAMYTAPLHKKQKLIHAHLSKPLMEKYNKRSMGLRKGDEVKISRGDFKGKTGKITKVDLKKVKVYIDGMKRKKTTGEEVNIPFHPSNLIITDIIMDDPRRKRIIDRVKK